MSEECKRWFKKVCYRTRHKYDVVRYKHNKKSTSCDSGNLRPTMTFDSFVGGRVQDRIVCVCVCEREREGGGAIMNAWN